MARKKTEEAPAGAPAWMATFSDLMNLLLCFFVLLFSMSTVDAEKFEMVIASLQSSFSILPSGGASIGDGEMVSSGVSQLQMYDIYYNQMANTQTTDDTSESSDVAEEYKEEALAESEQMAEQVQDLVAQYGIQDQVEIDFNAEYVLLNLNGAVLYATGAFFTRIAGAFVLLRLPILPYALFSLLLGAGLYGIKFWKYGKDERLRERI